MQLGELIEEIIKQPLFFTIESSRDFRLFIEGCTIASEMYHNRNRDTFLQEFSGFEKFIIDYFNISTDQDWGQIIRFFAENDWDSLMISFSLLKRFQDNYLQKDLILESKKSFTKESNIETFNDLMNWIKNNHFEIGIESIEDFNVFYIGLVCYKNPKGRNYFYTQHIHDSSFINFNDKKFKKHLCNYLKLESSFPYYQMIYFHSFMPKHRSLELFFKILEDLDLLTPSGLSQE